MVVLFHTLDYTTRKHFLTSQSWPISITNFIATYNHFDLQQKISTKLPERYMQLRS